MKSILQKIRFFVKKYPLGVSFIVLIICFLFFRLPFFIWMPLPMPVCDIFWDYTIVKQLQNHDFNNFGILPPGNILFLYFLEFFCSKTYHILLIQNLISLSVCLFLLYIISKTYRQILIYSSIALCIYFVDSYVLMNDTKFGTESLYRNSLLFITGLLLIAISGNKKWQWVVFSTSLLFPPLLRSNGLYIYFLILFLIFYFIINKFKTFYYLALLIPFILLNLSWSVFNKYYEGYMVPGNPTRIISTVKNFTNPESPGQSVWNYKFNLFWNLASFISCTRPSYYFTYLKQSYEYHYILDIPHDTTNKYWNFPDADSLKKILHIRDTTGKYWNIIGDTSLKKLVFKEIYSLSNPYEETSKKFNIQTSKNIWLWMLYIYYKIHSLLFNNYLWLLAFTIIYLYSLFKWVKSSLKNKLFFMVFCIGSIHFLAIISLTLLGWFQGRYIQVSEFVIYLYPGFGYLLLKEKSNAQQ